MASDTVKVERGSVLQRRNTTIEHEPRSISRSISRAEILGLSWEGFEILGKNYKRISSKISKNTRALEGLESPSISFIL